MLADRGYVVVYHVLGLGRFEFFNFG